MKRLFALILTICLLLGLCACGETSSPEQTTEPAMDVTATDADIAKLDGLYTGKMAYHGEMHDHADTGGYSDGKRKLDEWKAMMASLKDMDFAAIVDHKQVLHMTLRQWDNTLFIGGTEAGTKVAGTSATQDTMHYAMYFADVDSFEKTLLAFPQQYRYVPSEDYSNRYYYGNFTYEEMGQLVQTVLSNGGFFTHVHPMGDSYMLSENPEDYRP